MVNALGWLCQVALIRGLAGIGQGIVLGLRRDLFDHLTALSLRYFSEQRAGWIIARLTSDVDAISDALSQGLPTLVSNVVLLPTTLIVLFVVDWRLGLVAMVILPPALVLTRWFQKTSAVAQLEVRNRIAARHRARRRVGRRGWRSCRRSTASAHSRAQFDELNGENRTGQRLRAEAVLGVLPVDRAAGRRSRPAPCWSSVRSSWPTGTLTIGTLITAVYLLQLVFQPLQELSDVYGQLQAAAAAMVKISTVLDAEPEIGDRPGAKPIAARSRAASIWTASASPTATTEVLHGIDLHVPAGGCIALVGQTGGGKSTLAKLVARFYDPREGTVRVDGVDLREVQLRSYRRQLGVVLQDPFLFSGTIADNIRFGRPDASDEDVRRTAAAIGVDKLVARLVGGLEHPVREGGSGLSAGERQLISIARALLADPRILILDEATSNIDRPTEALIERALDTLLHGRSSIIIAHRLATVRRADTILVVERGNIVQAGSERELLAVDGSFQRLAGKLHSPTARLRGRPGRGPGRRRPAQPDAV